jgi:methyl-accepting chemotaxis protein
MKLHDIKIGYRLMLGFGLMLALMVGITAIAAIWSQQSRAHLTAAVGQASAKSAYVAAMRRSLFQQGLAARNIGATTDLNAMQKEMEKILAAQKDYQRNQTALAATGLTPSERALVTDMDDLAKTIAPSMKEAADYVAGFNAGQALKVLTTTVAPLQEKWLAALDRLVDLQNRDMQDIMQDFDRQGGRATGAMLALCLVAVAAAVIVGWRISHSVTAPVTRALALARSVAAGDLSVRVGPCAGDETGQLLAALGAMTESLGGTVGKVRSATETIALASQEIASGNADLSARTESQAGSLEETASSMEELTSTVRQNASHAKQANELAVSASQVAQQGGSIVADVVTTMASIRASSGRIVDIISVIDGIAFQTNILALNAAVEAARAGEQGKGFAVVASEVRHLAQRSAAAAKEIKELIGDSVGKVNSGAQLVDGARDTMEKVVVSIRQVSDFMQDITVASREQSAGIEEINHAIAQMDDMTQQNAALVEQAMAAADSLQQQAQSLADEVSLFKL